MKVEMGQEQYELVRYLHDHMGSCNHSIDCMDCPIQARLAGGSCLTSSAYKIANDLLKDEEGRGTCISIWKE